MLRHVRPKVSCPVTLRTEVDASVDASTTVSKYSCASVASMPMLLPSRSTACCLTAGAESCTPTMLKQHVMRLTCSCRHMRLTRPADCKWQTRGLTAQTPADRHKGPHEATVFSGLCSHSNSWDSYTVNMHLTHVAVQGSEHLESASDARKDCRVLHQGCVPCQGC